MNVLIIDDDPDFRNLLRSYLKQQWPHVQVDDYDPLEKDMPDASFPLGSYDILRAAVNHLYDCGIYCHGLCYPVVPEGEGRIRLLVSALHSADHIQQTLKAFESMREVASFAVEALDVLAKLE